MGAVTGFGFGPPPIPRARFGRINDPNWTPGDPCPRCNGQGPLTFTHRPHLRGGYECRCGLCRGYIKVISATIYRECCVVPPQG